MQIIYPNSEKINFPIAATVGFFDGVHAGHRFLIEELKSLAISNGVKSAVITFALHPYHILRPESVPVILTTIEEKTRQLATTGVDLCIILEFTPLLASMSAQEFMKSVLSDLFNVSTLLIGHDHRFGRNREEGFGDYYQYGRSLGINVQEATRYFTSSDVQVSSTAIRNALLQGNVDVANRMLTYPYSISGRVVKGEQLGRRIGYPTANIELLDVTKLLPANGVYAVSVRCAGEQFLGMLNIGVRPTVSLGLTKTIEVHIFDFNSDVYGEVIFVDFLAFIRGEIKFDSVEDLVSRLATDKSLVIKIINTLN